MTISFNQIPANLRVPLFYAEFDNSRANQGSANQEYRTLLIGNRLTTGTKAELDLQRVTSAEQAAEYFGEGSLLADMAASFLGINKINPLYCIALDDAGAGVAATGTITVSGTPTEVGTIGLMVAGRHFDVAVALTDTPTIIAAAIAAAVNADTLCVVSAAAALGVVTFTAKNDGTHGNEIDLSHSYFDDEALPAGITLVVVAMSGGLTNPDVDDVFAVLGDDQYILMSTPYLDSATLLKMETELADRFGPLRANDGYALYGKRGTFGTLTTLGESRNSQFTTIMGVTGPSSSWQFGAEMAAQVAAAASIDPARPFQTLPMKVFAPKRADRFTLEERNQLLYSGISTFSVSPSGKALLEGIITTFKENEFGSPDSSYTYLNSPLTLSFLRFDWRALITSKYPRHKVANNGTRFADGQAVVTPNVIKAEAINKFRQWELAALVENFDQFKEELIVERDSDDPNRINVLMPPDLVNQLVILGTKIQFLL
jgi:phage tail sheath gpL-like